jgi:hypothetical protein
VSSKIKKVMEDKRSPLKSKPLRNPGQSLREQRVDVIFNKVMAPVMMSLLFLLWAALGPVLNCLIFDMSNGRRVE